MRTNTRSGLIALGIAAPMAAAAALFSNAPADGAQFLPSPAVLMAEADTTGQDGTMGQGGMGGMMGEDETEGGMGGMMNMMQQMSRMMETCNEMMQATTDEGTDQRPGGTDSDTQQQ